MIDLEADLRGGLADVAERVPISPDPWGSYQQRRAAIQRGPRRRAVVLSVAGIVTATAVIVLLAIGVASLGGNASHHTPRLTGGRTVTLVPASPVGAAGLSRSATIIEARLHALGVSGASVKAVDGSLIAHVPRSALATLAASARTRGQLRFRQAMSEGNGTPTPSSADQGIAVRGPAESPTLTKAFLTSYSNWDCARDRNPTHGNDIASDYIIGCSPDGTAKYLLAPAAVEGSQVTSVNAELDPETGTQWIIDLGFNRSGSNAWQQVTAKAYRTNNGRPQNGTCTPPTGCDAVAITVDGVVQSAPYISQQGGIVGGQTQISGSFTQQSANRLAQVLKQGPLPTAFTVKSP